jgi:hypothetical protein
MKKNFLLFMEHAYEESHLTSSWKNVAAQQINLLFAGHFLTIYITTGAFTTAGHLHAPI